MQRSVELWTQLWANVFKMKHGSTWQYIKYKCNFYDFLFIMKHTGLFPSK